MNQLSASAAAPAMDWDSMSRKITPYLREQAAIYCSCMASWSMSGGLYPRWQFSKSIISMMDLLVAEQDCAICWAEAEALLRTGADL